MGLPYHVRGHRGPSVKVSIDTAGCLVEMIEVALERCRASGLFPAGAGAAVAVEIPKDEGHGDYASNVAMLLAKAAKRPPRQVAEAILRSLPSSGRMLEKAEIAGPGFINFSLSRDWSHVALKEALKEGPAYGRLDVGKGERVLVEFVSANPTGPLVIVNARAAAVGDSLTRLLEAIGYKVGREFYVNDAGNQFLNLARAMETRLQQILGEDVSLPDGVYPGEYIVDLARAYLERHGDGVLRSQDSERLDRLGRFAVERILAWQRETLKGYGVEFDCWFSERSLREAGEPERVVRALRERGFTYEAEGAVWFQATGLGDDKDRVLVKQDGEYTYFVPDIAYHENKFGRGFSRLIDLWGPDHHGYVPRMKAAMRAFGHPAGAFDVLIVQLVRLLRAGEPVRMSKRKGEFVLMDELLEEVGPDAARFTFLTRRHDSPLDFDLDLVTRHSSENPVYYVQYAHARVASIRAHMGERGLVPPPPEVVDLSRLALPEEDQLVKKLLQYPVVVRSAAQALEPHRLAYYLGELAGGFHAYYNRHRVVTEDLPLTFARYTLASAVGLVIRNGLGLLGVSAPESM